MQRYDYELIHQSPSGNNAWACVGNSTVTARGSGVVDLLALLKQCGEEGWEVCGTTADRQLIILKRLQGQRG